MSIAAPNPDENPHQREDFEVMQRMISGLENACNQSRIEPGRGEVRDTPLVKSVLSGQNFWHGNGGENRVIGEGDHFDVAAQKLIEAYPESEEAAKLQEITNRARKIISTFTG